jgi:dTDP-3-amino-2,3,6-trideoxy-4-keto-D-glucose/dTDP-3-amino-3,4,6-trideoxy-alpha-D-glucose/dTDP-2,6-dideoxy-D-kanosamine transaminase
LSESFGKIQINDLASQTQSLKQSLIEVIGKVIDSAWFIKGAQVEAFEAEFAQYLGAGYCIGVASGTDAIRLSLQALGVGPGDWVATAPNAGYYTVSALRLLGANPYYVDVEADSLNLCPKSLQLALSNLNIKAVVATHLYGKMADMPSIMSLCEERAVPVLEDCAQAHGAEMLGKKAGTWGQVASFSFYPTKNLGALGDGGAIVTTSGDMAEVIRQLAQYGWAKKYQAVLRQGCNSRLDEMQAAVLRIKLTHLNNWNQLRRQVAQGYNELLSGLDLQLPKVHGTDYVAHLFVLRSSKRDKILSDLRRVGILAEIHYPLLDVDQKAEDGLPWQSTELTTARLAVAQVLTLPCYPELPMSQVRLIAQHINKIIG